MKSQRKGSPTSVKKTVAAKKTVAVKKRAAAKKSSSARLKEAAEMRHCQSQRTSREPVEVDASSPSDFINQSDFVVKKRVAKVPPINKQFALFTITGTSLLVMHKWSEKAKELMRQKAEGRKTKTREVRIPEQECEDATYYDDAGELGIPLLALKKSILSAAHKDIGIERTLVSKSLFIHSKDSNLVEAFKTNSPPIMREDPVRVGVGSADLRYRPSFTDWSVEVIFEIDGDYLIDEDVGRLIDRAGFGIGICEGRPEKKGEWGRFELDASCPLIIHHDLKEIQAIKSAA